MLTYQKKPDSNVAEIVVDGKITDTEMDAVIASMKADLDGGTKLRLLQDIRTFEGMEPTAFFKDVRFGLALLKGVSHVAVYEWVRAAGEDAPAPSVAPTDNIAQIDEMWHFVDGKKQGLALEGL